MDSGWQQSNNDDTCFYIEEKKNVLLGTSIFENNEFTSIDASILF